MATIETLKNFTQNVSKCYFKDAIYGHSLASLSPEIEKREKEILDNYKRGFGRDYPGNRTIALEIISIALQVLC